MITATFDHKGGVGQKSEAGTLSPPRLLPPEAKQASPRRNTLHKNTVTTNQRECTAKSAQLKNPKTERHTKCGTPQTMQSHSWCKPKASTSEEKCLNLKTQNKNQEPCAKLEQQGTRGTQAHAHGAQAH